MADLTKYEIEQARAILTDSPRQSGKNTINALCDMALRSLESPPSATGTTVRPCCGEYATCGKPCTPRGEWIAAKKYDGELADIDRALAEHGVFGATLQHADQAGSVRNDRLTRAANIMLHLQPMPPRPEDWQRCGEPGCVMTESCCYEPCTVRASSLPEERLPQWTAIGYVDRKGCAQWEPGRGPEEHPHGTLLYVVVRHDMNGGTVK